MIDSIVTFGFGLAFYGVFWIVVVVILLLKQHERRMLWERRLEQLGEELRIRHLWAEARRYDLRVLLEKWAAVENGDAVSFDTFEIEIARQGKANGLDVDGDALPGYPPASALTYVELGELAVLGKVLG